MNKKHIDSENFLKKVQDLAHKENLMQTKEGYEENDPRLIEAAMELAEKSKSILGGLYFDFRKTDTGTLRKAKNKVIGKVANIVRNTLERPLLTQQKFNEQIYYLVDGLLKENKKLSEELEEIKKKIK